jgi:hypothetical protein
MRTGIVARWSRESQIWPVAKDDQDEWRQGVYRYIFLCTYTYRLMSSTHHDVADTGQQAGQGRALSSASFSAGALSTQNRYQ